jgi:hypothetical protein
MAMSIFHGRLGFAYASQSAKCTRPCRASASCTFANTSFRRVKNGLRSGRFENLKASLLGPPRQTHLPATCGGRRPLSLRRGSWPFAKTLRMEQRRAETLGVSARNQQSNFGGGKRVRSSREETLRPSKDHSTKRKRSRTRLQLVSRQNGYWRPTALWWKLSVPPECIRTPVHEERVPYRT